MKDKFNFENLQIYQESLLLAEEIYTITKSWPKEELFGLVSQLRRAAISIVLNISEGSSRTKKDFCHFLDMSRGSCFECVAILTMAKTLGYISDHQYKHLYSQLIKVSKMNSGLKKALSNNSEQITKH